jgi:hypothetical protein
MVSFNQLGKLRWENGEFEASLGYIVGLCLKMRGGGRGREREKQEEEEEEEEKGGGGVGRRKKKVQVIQSVLPSLT